MYGKSKSSTVPSDAQAREKFVFISDFYYIQYSGEYVYMCGLWWYSIVWYSVV